MRTKCKEIVSEGVLPVWNDDSKRVQLATASEDIEGADSDGLLDVQRKRPREKNRGRQGRKLGPVGMKNSCR